MPKQEDSGESQPQLGISKAGDTMVRKLLSPAEDADEMGAGLIGLFYRVGAGGQHGKGKGGGGHGTKNG